MMIGDSVYYDFISIKKIKRIGKTFVRRVAEIEDEDDQIYLLNNCVVRSGSIRMTRIMLTEKSKKWK